jgi:hypothetical protein
MANLLGTLITGNLRTTQGYGTSDSTRILYPSGGSFVTTTSVITGAIRIKMPVFGSGMMMTCTVKVYEYSSNKSFTITFGGHRDSDNWYNIFCYFDGDGNRENLTVRFGIDDGVNCVWIGETSNQWSYPQVFVTDVQMGYVGYNTSWLSGWSVGFVTSFGTVNRTATAFQKITTANIGSQSVNYASSAGNADTVDGYHANNAAGGIAVINANGYWYPPSWINVGGAGIYSGTNNAHLLPNGSSPHGAWEMIGSKNGWSGIYFRDSGNTLMANANDSGFYNANAGWQINWYNGTLSVSKQANGGGTLATVLDSSNYSSWAQPASTAINTGNIASQSVNYATTAGSAPANGGTSTHTYRGIIEDTRAGQRTPNAYDDYRVSWEFTNQMPHDSNWLTIMTMQGWHDGYAAWQIMGTATATAYENWYLRSGINGTWNAARTIIHSGNIASQSVSYADESGYSASSGSVEWTSVQNKPATFPPSSHTHDDRYLVKGGAWYGSGLPGSRWGGFSVSGGEIVFGDGLPNAGQMGILIDGAYLAGENNGFWSLASDNSWSSRRGMYWDGSYLNFTTNSPNSYFYDILIGGSSHKYLTINPGNGYEAMVRYIGGSGSSWYVGKRTANQLVGTESFHFYSEAASQTVGGIDTSGNMIVTGSMRAPIFYDSNNTSYYLDPNSTTSGYFAGVLRQNDGKYVRDAYYRTISGYGDLFSGGSAGWTTIAEITLAYNCGGAVLYGTLFDHRYDGADAYQLSIVARSECDFTSNNDSHYVNVGCTITGSTAIGNYRDKIRLLLVYSVSGARTYELQVYETAWNHNTWQLESTGWTIHTSAQSARTGLEGAKVNYISNQNADYQRANEAMYSPIYYDANDTGFYLDPNGTSHLNKFSERTMAFNGMNPKSANSPYVARYDGSVGYRNGTMGYANTDFNTIARNWGSGFIDTWSSPANAPGSSTHYIGLQGVHYSDGGTSFYGFQMACAGEADNRFFWRSSWPNMRSWVEMIHSGNISSQSVSNSATTSQRDFSGDISTSGMGRFAGWYNGNAQTGLAAEIGVSAGQAYIIAYNRQSGAYGTLNLESTGTNLRISGSTVNVTSGTLQQGGNNVIHAGNIGSQSVNYATSAGSAPNGSNVNSYYDVTAGVGNGLRFWGGSNAYKISMGVGSLYQYGTVSDYSIKMQMDDGSTGRGFTWGRESSAPIASLNSKSGDFQVAGNVYAPIFYDSNDTNYFVDPNSISQLNYVLANNWFRPQGSTGLYFQTYGRGIWSADSAGASYGNVSIYGDGINSWPGYAINNLAIFMARDIRRGIFIPSADSWLIRYEQSSNMAFVDFELQWGSDIRYKSNIKRLTGALDTVKQLKGVTYNYKGNERTSIGFIAQEVEPILPEVVSTDADGFKSIGYANIVALLSEAIKEQQVMIEQLKARIDILESK